MVAIDLHNFLGGQHWVDTRPPKRAGHKRTRSNLPSKRGIPPSGNTGGAGRAATLRREEVTRDEVAVTLDEQLLAARAARVFQVAHLPGQIPGINVMQASPPADLGSPHQRLCRGVDP